MENKFKSLILVSDKSKLALVYKVYSKLSAKGEKPLILTMRDNLNIDKKYSALGFKAYQGIFKINYPDIRAETYNLFYSIANQQVRNCLDFRALTTYKGVSLWELSAVPIFSELTSLLYDINIADAILSHEQPSQVHIIDGTKQLERVITLICASKRIPCFSYEKTSAWIISIKKCFCEVLTQIKAIKKTLLSMYFMFINFTKSKKLNTNYKIIFFAPYGRFFASMLPVALQYNDNQRLVINTSQSDSLKIMEENNIFYMHSYGYKLYGGLFDREMRNFLRDVESAINSDIFLSQITYKTFPIGSLLSGMFKRAIYEYFPEKIRDIDSIRKIIVSYEPKIVVIADVSFDIALIAKSLFKRIVRIQTGHANEFIFFGPLIADDITVEGNYWKEYLSNKGVDEKKISVVGILKLDILNSNILFRKKSDLSLIIDKSRKNIVFADVYGVSTFGTLESERVEHINALFNAVENIRDVNLIIKLHPCATDKDFAIYKNKAKEIKHSNYKIVKDENMLDLINNSDLLVSHSSGASYEAVLMKKNAMLTSYSSDFNSEDVWDFQRYGVVIAVNDLKELEGHMHRALFDPEITSKLEINREKYIFDHAYKMDGKAAERVREVIDRLL